MPSLLRSTFAFVSLSSFQDMLSELFRRGPSTDGIFRKSALMKTVKQIRQDLEDSNAYSLIIVININHSF